MAEELDLSFESEEAKKSIINMHSLLKNDIPAERKARLIIESTENELNFLQKDSLDRFIDYAYFKAKTGYPYILSLAYPSKRIVEKDIEKMIIELINRHLSSEIIFRFLRFFTRNARNADTNLYLAYMIENEDIIKSIYDTFVLFRNDVFKENPEERTANVKSIQQYISVADNRFSSPLDASCRLKYILEYIALKQNVSKIYTPGDLMVSKAIS